jgi:hypothetical protein
MQFQVAVVSIGYKAADYFRGNPGRFISAHLADWSSADNKQVPIGKGVVDWQDFYAAAEIGGVKRFFVEMDPMAHDGIARTIRPAHTMLDGDVIFALSTGTRNADVTSVGAFAAEVIAQAIMRAVKMAKPAGGLPGLNKA